MRSCLCLGLNAATIAVSVLLTPTARALDVYSTSFENSPFTAGSQLQGQDGWSSGNPPFLNPSAATITNSAAKAGLQSLQIAGAALLPFPESAHYASVSPNARPVNFDATAAGAPIVKVRADVRIDGPAGLTPSSNFAASIAAVPSEGRYSELVLSTDGVLYALSSFGPEVVVESIGNTLNAWHELEITIDFVQDAYTFRYDAQSFGPFSFPASVGADTLLRGSIVTYALPDEAGFARADYTARFDNFSITAIPEPASFFVAVCGGLGSVFFRRRGEKFAPDSSNC